MRALALDVGSKTIGLALSDAEGMFASAHGLISRKGHVDDAAEVMRQASAQSAQALVVGLPLELDGSEGVRARRVRRFLTALETANEALETRLSIETWDERFSTSAAERTLLEADVSRKKRKGKIDALAAQFILQGWLNARADAAPTSEGSS